MECSYKEMTLTWVATTDRYSRLDFLKRCIIECSLEETKMVINMATNNKKRQIARVKAKEQKETEVTETNVALEAAHSSTLVAQSSASGPSTLEEVSVPSPRFRRQGWWEKYPSKRIVAIDCEMVGLKKKNEYNRHPSVAATVAIVNFDLQQCVTKQEGSVYHKENTFLVSPETIEINGFEGKCLEGGKPFGEVKEMVKRVLENALVITVSGKLDFDSLNLTMSDYDVFDLQNFWRKWNGTRTKLGKKNYQAISLRKLCLHYFGKDIQNGIHSARKDAFGTIKLFKDVYCPLLIQRNVQHLRNYTCFDDFDDILF